jgi:hypothetical protein
MTTWPGASPSSEATAADAATFTLRSARRASLRAFLAATRSSFEREDGAGEEEEEEEEEEEDMCF